MCPGACVPFQTRNRDACVMTVSHLRSTPWADDGLQSTLPRCPHPTQRREVHCRPPALVQLLTVVVRGLCGTAFALGAGGALLIVVVGPRLLLLDLACALRGRVAVDEGACARLAVPRHVLEPDRGLDLL